MPDDRAASGADKPASAAAKPAAPPVTILHVDDDDANRYAVTRSLQRAGFKVEEAATGEQALQKMSAHPDLVILDVRLPDINGFEVCRRIKADPATSSTPILHLSASYVSSQDKATGLEAGADAYLIRPVEPVELVATVNALLRQRNTEEALRRSKVEAEMANRLKDEFLATLSHELRTPLNAIIGWASLLRAGQVSAQDMSEGLETIERNAKAQAQLIEDLLDVSRIISGKLRLDVQQVELQPVVEAALASVYPAADAKGVHLQRVLSSSGTTVTGDPGRLQQVVWNLLSNAVKFTPRDGRVMLTLARAGTHVEIVVDDSGEGIDLEFLPHVFERFRQADSSSRRQKGGLGLGLAIVRHLVELHGGTVEASSEGKGKGSRFTVTLPVTAVQRYAGPEEQKSMGERRAAGSLDCDPVLTGARVLVVDDEEDSRRLITRILEDCEAQVTAVGSVREAFSAIRSATFDVLISDIGMPVNDGYDLIRELRALPPDRGGRIPAIALTAFARNEDRRRALLAGFQVHLPKPVDPAELLAVVASILGRTGVPRDPDRERSAPPF